MIRWCSRGARVGESDSSLSVSALFEQLAPSERALLANMANRTHARERALAFALLRQVEGLGARSDPISYEPDGRPRIDSQPLDISIAHRAGRVAVASVNKPDRVGIDIEDLEGDIDSEGFRRYALSPEELVVLDALMAQKWSQAEATIALWSAKEAYFKCVGYSMKPLELVVEAWDGDGEIVCSARSGLLLHERNCSIPTPHLRAFRRGRWLTVVAVACPGAAPDSGK